ncbi:histone-fold-containing protein [Boletus reticuloceps]|uniref:DNA polymerase epsilon subunit D n=1 Tax=Boletus reticuloceps TaxID=495285 RepID=A0A8I2YCB8_9AGAM|nr:histone-fold-containing protein [Boletus reticuloceps]
MPRKDAGGGPMSAQAQQDLVSEGIENFELPKSLVTKIAKSAIPDNAKLQKETVLSLVKGSTVFINYLGEQLFGRYLRRNSWVAAHDVALSKQHKSISASDVLKALEMIEFGDLVDPLQNELQIHRENTKGDKNRKSGVDRNNSSSKGKAKEGESISSASRSKGKAKGALPPPFTTLPRPVVPSSVSHTTEDVNMGVPTGENEDVGEGEGEGEGGGENDSEMADEVDDAAEYDETEEEELMDVVADKSAELRRDAAGLDEAPAED